MMIVTEHGKTTAVPKSGRNAQIVVPNALRHDDQLGIGGADLCMQNAMDKTHRLKIKQKILFRH